MIKIVIRQLSSLQSETDWLVMQNSRDMTNKGKVMPVLDCRNEDASFTVYQLHPLS